MRLLFVSVLLILNSGVLAQSGGRHIKDYSIQIWTTDQGLPSNNLTNITQASNGYMWITTFNGLIRFDGHTFDIYNTEKIPELKSNGFSIINENDSSLYFGTLTSGLLEYDGKAFSLNKIENDFSGSISSIFIESTDKIWLGVKNSGIYYKDQSSAEFVHVDEPLLENSLVQSIIAVNSDELWMGTNHNGIIRYKGGKYSRVSADILNGLSINSMLQIEDDHYIGTNSGVYRNRDNRWERLPGTEGYFINDLKYDKLGDLWVASETGLIRISNNNTVQYLKETDGLPSRQISSIAFDNEGNIWLTSKRGGLVQLKSSNFLNISVDDGLQSQYVNIVYQLQDGSYAIGNDNGGIDIYKDNKITPLPIDTDLSSVSVKDIIQDKSGTIWVATYQGLLKIKDGSDFLLTKEDGMISNNIRSLFEDSGGNIWVGAKDEGVVRISSTGKQTRFSLIDGLSDNYVFCFEQLPNGDVIAGTYHGGINIFRNDGTIEVINLGTDSSSPIIFNIEVVDDENYWLATDVGLYKYSAGKFGKISLNDGLLVSTIFDVYSDPNGYLWVTSNLGVVRLSLDKLNQFLDDKTSKINARIYDEGDGMLSRECTGATKVLIDTAGKIVIPTSKGISIVDPSNIYINNKVPPLYIKKVVLDDQLNDVNLSEIEIGPGNQRVSISYTALSYYSPSKVNFKYRLKGFEKEWNMVGNQREAIYMNLPDGNFVFEVLAANNDGLWNETPATIALSIEPYFYKSRLFYLLLSVFLASIAIVIYWIRIRVVEEKNKELRKLNNELDSFVYSVSHDLRAPLSSILGLISISKIDVDGKNLPVYLDKIETSVHKLDDFIKEIISYSRNVRMQVEVDEIDLKTLVEDTFESLSYMNTDNSITVTVEAPENAIITSDKTRLQVILNNIISNAFRYYKPYINNAYIKAIIKMNVAGASIIIEDNGIGIKKDQQTKIFDMFYRATENSNGSGLGLYIAQESAAKIEGSIRVDSVYEHGTKFTISLTNL